MSTALVAWKLVHSMCAPKVFQLRMVSGQISLAGRSAAYCCLWRGRIPS
ncbi:hypothetical protein RchiOBHm_Chr6g0247581 [Rosa chinensis]|uniref:Uncharacterized protein n=1 Tax=Rosa chinensis TaxID=74649 RepID=A0A2P6PJT1_ROSCH|nr:hypothetical protein RchiOBHm_Chr6g0247581 [Rosa chinensis]